MNAPTLIQRLDVMIPGRDPVADDLRLKLLVARDMACARIGQWEQWPADHHRVHQIVSTWAGRALYSHWPSQDLEQTVNACRHLVTGTLILRRLGEVYGDVE